MKLFLDTKARRFVKSAASNVALQTLVLKRRDQVPLEVVFVENGVAVDPVAGTATTVALKSSFSSSNFLALAAPGTNTLDLYTEPVEAAFSSDPASIPAFLEIRWTAPTQALRTATLQVEIQNSVILGDEATPAAIPDGKATQAEAEAGTDNEKWMTPLRTAQAIEALAATDWDSISGKPNEFPPEAHTQDASTITGLSEFIISSAPALQINTTVRTGDGTSVTFPIDGLVSSDPEHVLVALNGVTQTPGTDYLVSEATGTITFDAPPASGMQISCTALGLRTVQPPIDPTLYLYAFDQSSDGLTTFLGRLLNADRPAEPALPETATSWTIKRSTLSAAGRILATASAVGAWANRETATYS
jgi:acyl dehydratase